MTTQPTVTTADTRRAAALIAHVGTGDDDGIAAVVTEAAETGRLLHLTFALVLLYAEIVPELRTHAGLQLLSAHILRLAGLEGDEA